MNGETLLLRPGGSSRYTEFELALWGAGRVQGRPVRRLLDEVNSEVLVHACDQAAASGQMVTFEATFAMPNRTVEAQSVVVPFFDDRDTSICRYLVAWLRNPDAVHSPKLGDNQPLAFGLSASQLWQAIDKDELLLHYQPIHEVRTGNLVGAEALVRWQHPDRGLLQPADFLPMAEATGIISDLGDWVLREACADAAAWNRRAGSDLGVSVNLSARQIADGSILRSARASLAASGLNPELLTLELSERDFIGGGHTAVDLLAHLRVIGVHIAIDDFGVGYSNLARLRSMRGRIVKVDRSLVSGIDVDDELLNLIGFVVEMAKSLDCVVVAEGVEEPGELDRLRSLGIDFSQGFHHARPMPVADFLTYADGSVPTPGRSSVQTG